MRRVASRPPGPSKVACEISVRVPSSLLAPSMPPRQRGPKNGPLILDEPLSTREAAVFVSNPGMTEIEQLIDALRNQAPEHRHARVSLDHAPSPAFVAPLVKATRDPNAYVRASAVHALASYAEEDGQIREALFAALADDPQPSVRSAAAEVLAGMSTQAVPALLAALGDASLDVRKEAVLALGSHMTSDVLPAVTHALHHDPAPEVRERAVLALERSMPECAIDDLIRALEDESAIVRSAAACALGEYETGATPAIVTALVGALSDPLADVRESAARALRYSSAEAIPGLMAQLEDEAAGVRKEVIGTLGTLEACQAIDALAQRLRADPDAEVRCEAASALGNLRHASATPHLIDAFDSEADSHEVRAEIVRALGDTGDFKALPTLCAALRDTDAETRESAARGLDALVKPDVPESSSALAPLCAALQDAECSVREAARSALGSLGDPRALPFLIQAARDDTDVPLETALEAIARIDATAAERLLLEGLAHPDTGVQRTAAKFLVLAEDGPIPPEVLTCLAAPDGDPFAKCDLAKSLARRGGPEAAPLLIELLRDGSGHVRAAAAQALGERPDPRAITPLMSLLGDDDEDVRGETALALAALADDRAIGPLAELLDDQCAPVRRRAVWALSFLPPSKVLPHLVAGLQDDDPHVQSTAVSALADVCDAPTLRRIRSALPSAFDDVGSALEEAAAGLEDETPCPRSSSPRRVQLGTLHYE